MTSSPFINTTHEEPRIIFLHFWGRGAAKLLAENVKARTCADCRQIANVLDE
jgi:hypothetical protein